MGQLANGASSTPKLTSTSQAVLTPVSLVCEELLAEIAPTAAANPDHESCPSNLDFLPSGVGEYHLIYMAKLHKHVPRLGLEVKGKNQCQQTCLALLPRGLCLACEATSNYH